jgi:hypothetical protein
LTGHAEGRALRTPGVLHRAALRALGFALLLQAGHAAPAAPAPAPLAIYTDILSGPNKGGENDKGIYLSVFGKHFGTSGLGKTTKVYIGGAEVDNYRYLGPSRGRPDIQQITVQVGALGDPKPGVALPIKVVVEGRASNADLVFTVNPGDIYFVDNVAGVDTQTITAGGSFEAPFRTVQKAAGKRIHFAIDPAYVAGAWGRVQAGDFIVMRGKGAPWTDIGFDGYFLRALNKSGCAVGDPCAEGGGRSSGPITLMGYPGEDVFINNVYSPRGSAGAISSASSARIREGKGSWITVSNLRIEGGNNDGVVNTQLGGSHWRVVNNELTAATAVANVNAKAGGIVGSGVGEFWVGNHIHDVYQGPPGTHLQNHGVYVGDDPDSAGNALYEIAYNRIENIFGGNGFQIHVGSGATGVANNVSFHHNTIRNVAKHGINIADGAQGNIVIWNNIVHDTWQAGIRFGGTSLVRNLKLYNNTFFNTATLAATVSAIAANYGALTNEMNAGPRQFDIRNNIFWPSPGAKYVVDKISGALSLPVSATVSHNLWFGGSGANPAATFSGSSLQADPRFVATRPGSENFRLQSGSPAIDKGTGDVSAVVTDDHDISGGNPPRPGRPQGAGYDIGAYEFSSPR